MAESGVIDDLSDAERSELERRHYVRVGEELIWLEPDGEARRERATNLYYIRTARGIFRLSRITHEVVEV